jgi:hypothetical protein
MKIVERVDDGSFMLFVYLVRGGRIVGLRGYGASKHGVYRQTYLDGNWVE